MRTPEWTAAWNANRREKYKNDPEYRKKIIEGVKRSSRRHPESRQNRDLRAYGMTLEDYRRMVAAQGGLCAICRKKQLGDKRTKHSHVDHCHKTGKVRGILCGNCNIGIGKFNDNPELLDRAAAYLDAAKAKQLEQS